MQQLQTLPLQIAQPLFLEAGIDPRAKKDGLEGFGEVVLGADLDAFHDHGQLVGGRHHDHGQSAQRAIRLYQPQNTEPVEFRHLHVEQHQVERLAARHVHGRPAIRGLDHLDDPHVRQFTDQDAPQHPAVVDDKNAHRRRERGEFGRNPGHLRRLVVHQLDQKFARPGVPARNVAGHEVCPVETDVS